jgi:ketosteroid isomerase-like protein
MKKLAGAVLFACLCVGLFFLHTSSAQSEDERVVDSLRQFERDYGNAIKAADVDKLNQILDDDWTELVQNGPILTKKRLLGDLKSGMYKLESCDFGPMYVKVLGDVAVVQGSSSETSAWNGKESNGKSVWMDVLEKRGNEWVVVRSQSAKVK